MRVALETAVVTHGLPRPLNLQVARECEAAVREEGAIPATIGILDGRICSELTPAELERLALMECAQKCGAPDIGALVARGGSGGTTVSGTLALAAHAGIVVMSTGGIGGVHRGGADVSADLLQLARSPVTVVCSGAKSILDLPRTLEALETFGVPVLGYCTDEFPGFYIAKTGLRLTHRVESPQGVVRAVQAYRAIGYGGAILVTRPAPGAMPPAALEEELQAALAQADEQGITGAAVTPFLLKALAEETSGKTLEINRGLLIENARLAARIAVRLSK